MLITEPNVRFRCDDCGEKGAVIARMLRHSKQVILSVKKAGWAIRR